MKYIKIIITFLVLILVTGYGFYYFLVGNENCILIQEENGECFCIDYLKLEENPSSCNIKINIPTNEQKIIGELFYLMFYNISEKKFISIEKGNPFIEGAVQIIFNKNNEFLGENVLNFYILGTSDGFYFKLPQGSKILGYN